MPLCPFDLARARDAVEAMLARLELDAVLFAVEHTESGWQLRVECATQDGWQVETIALGEELPDTSEEEAPLRARMFALLEERLARCKRRRPAEQ